MANNVKKLTNSTAFHLRVGDYRVIFEESETEIILSIIAPRGSAYELRGLEMGVTFFTTPMGEELALLPRDEFEALADTAAHARSVADYRSGRLPGLTSDETRALIASPTPLTFWRKKRALTQGALGARVGVTQTYICELERGNRAGTVEVWLKIAKALGVPIESLVDQG